MCRFTSIVASLFLLETYPPSADDRPLQDTVGWGQFK